MTMTEVDLRCRGRPELKNLDRRSGERNDGARLLIPLVLLSLELPGRLLLGVTVGLGVTLPGRVRFAVAREPPARWPLTLRCRLPWPLPWRPLGAAGCAGPGAAVRVGRGAVRVDLGRAPRCLRSCAEPLAGARRCRVHWRARTRRTAGPADDAWSAQAGRGRPGRRSDHVVGESSGSGRAARQHRLQRRRPARSLPQAGLRPACQWRRRATRPAAAARPTGGGRGPAGEALRANADSAAASPPARMDLPGRPRPASISATAHACSGASGGRDCPFSSASSSDSFQLVAARPGRGIHASRRRKRPAQSCVTPARSSTPASRRRPRCAPHARRPGLLPTMRATSWVPRPPYPEHDISPGPRQGRQLRQHSCVEIRSSARSAASGVVRRSTDSLCASGTVRRRRVSGPASIARCRAMVTATPGMPPRLR